MIDPSIILANINSGLREPLLLHFQSIRTNYIERRWEPSELNGGKFAEVVYTIISDILNSTQSKAPSKPKNMLAACQALEQVSSNPTRVGDRSLRILIPRTLPILYEIRNNRNVGHVGGEIDPNFMDATTVYSLANWVLAELIRIVHNIKIEDAQLVVDGIVERKQLLVWEINDMKRVLNPELPKKDQALLLLYQNMSGVNLNDLRAWVEYKNPTSWKTKILKPLHSARLIEWNQETSMIYLSPLGVTDVEKRLLKPNS